MIRVCVLFQAQKIDILAELCTLISNMYDCGIPSKEVTYCICGVMKMKADSLEIIEQLSQPNFDLD